MRTVDEYKNACNLFSSALKDQTTLGQKLRDELQEMPGAQYLLDLLNVHDELSSNMDQRLGLLYRRYIILAKQGHKHGGMA